MAKPKNEQPEEETREDALDAQAQRDALKPETGTRDQMDAGVPMPVGEPHEGPEDALDPNARGDYSERLKSGPSAVVEQTPDGPQLKEVAPGA